MHIQLVAHECGGAAEHGLPRMEDHDRGRALLEAHVHADIWSAALAQPQLSPLHLLCLVFVVINGRDHTRLLGVEEALCESG